MEKLNKTWKTEPILGEENPPDASATKVFTCPVIANLEFEVQHSIICKAYVISKQTLTLLSPVWQVAKTSLVTYQDLFFESFVSPGKIQIHKFYQNFLFFQSFNSFGFGFLKQNLTM